MEGREMRLEDCPSFVGNTLEKKGRGNNSDGEDGEEKRSL